MRALKRTFVRLTFICTWNLLSIVESPVTILATLFNNPDKLINDLLSQTCSVGVHAINSH